MNLIVVVFVFHRYLIWSDKCKGTRLQIRNIWTFKISNGCENISLRSHHVCFLPFSCKQKIWDWERQIKRHNKKITNVYSDRDLMNYGAVAKFSCLFSLCQLMAGKRPEPNLETFFWHCVNCRRGGEIFSLSDGKWLRWASAAASAVVPAPASALVSASVAARGLHSKESKVLHHLTIIAMMAAFVTFWGLYTRPNQDNILVKFNYHN